MQIVFGNVVVVKMAYWLKQGVPKARYRYIVMDILGFNSTTPSICLRVKEFYELYYHSTS